MRVKELVKRERESKREKGISKEDIVRDREWSIETKKGVNKVSERLRKNVKERERDRERESCYVNEGKRVSKERERVKGKKG